ncbi:GFA family protein [Microdochium nivale]|nr:GFA family protein [Microdochium nivale]
MSHRPFHSFPTRSYYALSHNIAFQKRRHSRGLQPSGITSLTYEAEQRLHNKGAKMSKASVNTKTHGARMRITCHCGAAAQTVALPGETTTSTTPVIISICHCCACRHVSGVVCTSYLEIAATPPPSLVGLVAHDDDEDIPPEDSGLPDNGSTEEAISRGCIGATRRWFCGTCGSHVFARQSVSAGELRGGGGGVSWAIATGCLIGDADDGDVPLDDEKDLRQAQHKHEEGLGTSRTDGTIPFRFLHFNVHDAEDGGLAPILTAKIASESLENSYSSVKDQAPEGLRRQHWATASTPLSPLKQRPHPPPSPWEEDYTSASGTKDIDDHHHSFAGSRSSTDNAAHSQDVLDLHCLCRRVSLVITRPDASSLLPWSPHSDSVYPYHTTSQEILQNKGDEKWWIRPSLADEEEGRKASVTGRGRREDHSKQSTENMTATVLTQPAQEEKEDHNPQGLDEPSTTKANMKRYLANTCTCRSCRLICGFEIQTWAFVPRSNIFVEDSRQESLRRVGGGKLLFPLDFSRDHDGMEDGKDNNEHNKTTPLLPLPPPLSNPTTAVLRTYRSQQGVRREFCPTCGATVFWHNGERPDVIDVSAGLVESYSGSSSNYSGMKKGGDLRFIVKDSRPGATTANVGARAENWLDWWTERVSFFEHVAMGRTGLIAAMGTRIAADLQDGLQAWGRHRKGVARDE